MDNQYVVVLPIEDMPQRATYDPGKPLPLHCAVMPWFELDADFSSFTLSFGFIKAACCVETGRIPLISKCFEVVGPENDLPCHTLRDNDRLHDLHMRLLVLFDAHDFRPMHEEYLGGAYKPYVSDSGRRQFPVGSKYAASMLVLIKQDRYGRKEVLRIEELGNPYRKKASRTP